MIQSIIEQLSKLTVQPWIDLWASFWGPDLGLIVVLQNLILIVWFAIFSWIHRDIHGKWFWQKSENNT